MSGIAINAKPLMTEYLVRERVFDEDPLIIFDAGARGGANPEWLTLRDQAKIFCFEPDRQECDRLSKSAPPNIKYVPVGLARRVGEATLYETELPASAGLYKTRMDYFGRFVNGQNGVTRSEIRIAVKSLDEVARELNVEYVDFLKLDVEGAELDVLMGAPTLIKGGLLGVLSEFRFHREINGSPPFSTLDAFLQEQGLQLFDIQPNRHSRKGLPYPQTADYRLPSGKRFFAYTTRGQVQDGDALFFRDLFSASPVSPIRLLKICVLMETYSLNDCAAELLIANADRIDGLVPVKVLLNLLTLGISDDAAGYEQYRASYFADTPPEYPCTPKQAEAMAPVPSVVVRPIVDRLLSFFRKSVVSQR
jgi:FkbM family methyltransferase